MACVIIIREEGHELFRVEAEAFDDPQDALPLAREIAQITAADRNSRLHRSDHIPWTMLERAVIGYCTAHVATEVGPVPDA